MLSLEEFHSWAHECGVTDSARTLIERIRSSEPLRLVQGGAGNVSGRWPSSKMRRTIQFESETELYVVLRDDVDEDVLEFYDQPYRLKLSYHNAGRHRASSHVPDFFELRRSSAGFVECKTEKEVTRRSDLFVQGTDGRWTCPSGEAFAAQFGLFYRVFVDSEINPVFKRNALLLRAYWQRPYAVSPEVRRRIAEVVGADPGISLDSLATFAGPSVSKDALLAAIAAGDVYVDLGEAWLGTAAEVRVFLNRDVARAFQIVARASNDAATESVERLEAGDRVLLLGKHALVVSREESRACLLGEDGSLQWIADDAVGHLRHDGKLTVTSVATARATQHEALERFRRAGPAAVAEALRRLAIVDRYERDADVPDGVSLRTLQRWRSSTRKARLLCGTPLLGLIPGWSSRGNRDQLDPAVRELVAKAIDEGYETSKRRNRFSTYGDLVLSCERAGLVAPSYVTFCRQVKARSAYDSTRKREGTKAAYTHAEAVHEGSLAVPRHGDRPWETTHVDHTELDVELRHSRTGVLLGRPWASFVVDAFSRRILALYVSFDPPSYRSCMMVLRECVRRFSYFPESIWTDGGKEFQSVYYEQLLAAFECAKKNRPKGRVRFGSVLERLIGTTNTEFLHDVAGNTQSSKDVRRLTPEVDPRRQAIWTLPDLSEFLGKWAFERYDQQYHPELGCSPREAYERATAELGRRPQRRVVYDDLVHILTCPSTAKGVAKVRPGQGVLINYHYYWSPALRDPRIENTEVAVRHDPFDPSIAYASVNGVWVKCVTQLPDYLRGASERVIKLAAAEVKKQHALRGLGRRDRARQRALFVEALVEREEVLRQRLKDEDVRAVYGAVMRGGGRLESVASALDGGEATAPARVIRTRRIEEM